MRLSKPLAVMLLNAFTLDILVSPKEDTHFDQIGSKFSKKLGKLHRLSDI